MAAIQKNILEHISLMAQEQVQIEFVEELPKTISGKIKRAELRNQ